MDAVQPDFEIIAKEHKNTSQNLDDLEGEVIKDSLTSLMLTVSEKGSASARRSRNTASLRAAEKA